jgi:3-ketosteroid 9alpha-monooxygenase subunit B
MIDPVTSTPPSPPSVYSIAIGAVRDETPMDRTLSLPVPAGAEKAFQFVPGQFVTVSDPDDDVRPPRKRAYSISSSPTDRGSGGEAVVEITVRDMGDFGARLYRFPVGGRLDVIPPRGRFLLEPNGPAAASPAADDLLLLAGGSGVTPFRSFARRIDAAAEPGTKRRTTLVYSGQLPNQLMFDAEFRALAAREPWFRYVPTVTRLDAGEPFDGRRGRVDAALMGSLVRDPARTLVYACGPAAFVNAVLDLAKQAGVPAPRTKREVWG